MARQNRKLTIEIPANLLTRAIKASGQGVTPTVRRGLELVASGGAYGRLAFSRQSEIYREAFGPETRLMLCLDTSSLIPSKRPWTGCGFG